ncbi:hypothetical protein SAMN05421542_1881 [Chryseobacterium jejuense]|uniref:Uncharacterized protein n=1 Tax=Chryseobacterium jejuense TaxID=445960 RepID=A0A2X2VH87_CHRJE|nr:hypothetical protein SAMN05421542_1881 [Chryseobacterium jejuense]SQB27754.1 Uncharacterised protein [Chryseobacterium jejuense]
MVQNSFQSNFTLKNLSQINQIQQILFYFEKYFYSGIKGLKSNNKRIN